MTALKSLRPSPFALSLACLLALWACEPAPAFQSFEDLPEGQWRAADGKSFAFQVDETANAYDLSYNVRADIDYPFYNLYVKYDLTDAQGEILRSARRDANLMDPETGRPLGKGTGDLYEYEIALLEGYEFPEPGRYVLTVRHDMRPDTLTGIQSVGATLRFRQEDPTP